MRKYLRFVVQVSGSADAEMEASPGRRWPVQAGDLIGAAAFFHTGKWQATITAVTTSTTFVVFEIFQLVHVTTLCKVHLDFQVADLKTLTCVLF